MEKFSKNERQLAGLADSINKAFGQSEPRGRGRPRSYENLMLRAGAEMTLGFTNRAKQNGWHAQAGKLMVERYRATAAKHLKIDVDWLYRENPPRIKRTVLAALNRLAIADLPKAEEIAVGAMLRICEGRLKTREALAFIAWVREYVPRRLDQ